MSYLPITVRTSMPGDGADAGGQELYGVDTAEVYLTCSNGTGTACLIQRGPAGKWRQYGPSWTVDTSQAGQQVQRIAIPRDRWLYQILVTGGPTIDEGYIVGENRGR